MRYAPEVKQFIFENYKGTSYYEMMALVKERFGLELTPLQVKNFYGNNHLDSGLNGQFKNHHTTHNKGKKQTEYMSDEAIERTKATRFKKGNIPHNYKPVGSERISKDGYIEVKIQDPAKWKLKHRLIWEQAYGEVPKGSVVIFLDHNKLNCSLDNLALVEQTTHIRMCQNNLYSEDKDLTKAGIMLGKLSAEIGKKKH